MKVAFATTDGRTVNEHFGRAGQFAVYEVTREGYSFLETRKFAEGRDTAIKESREMGPEHESRVEAKVGRLEDCRLIYMEQIGGPSAARLSRKGIMPLKVQDILTIEDNLERLMETIRGNPPLWLRKALEQ
jgi:nitrogen fixation protein NifX